MVIGLITGFWSTNIGNAFFHLGANTLLNQLASKDDQIIWLNNMPAYWRLFNKTNPVNSVRGIGEPHLDVLVMVGPFLRKAFPDIWTEEISRLKTQGTKIIMIGLGAMQHDSETRDVCRQWFKTFKPDFIATRDQATFDTLDGLGLNAEPVICPAFFVSEAVKKPLGEIDPYLVINCEKVLEPEIKLIGSATDQQDPIISVAGKELMLSPQSISHNTYLERFAELSINFKSFFIGSSPAGVGDVPVYRTIHRSNPFILRSLFPRPNTMVSDVPHPYLLAYANASYIVTDRVHTAVAGVSYGTPVVFVGKTKRQGLLLAGGVTIHDSGILSVDYEEMGRRKSRLKELVAKHVFGRTICAYNAGLV